MNVMISENPNRILIDWFTFSSKIHTIDTIFDFLGLVAQRPLFVELSGRWGYQKRLSYAHIDILYDYSLNSLSERNECVCVDLSGKGCRSFETFSTLKTFISLFEKIRHISAAHKENLVNVLNSESVFDCNFVSKPFNISRIDFAFDDFNREIDVKVVQEYLENGYVRTHVQKFSNHVSHLHSNCITSDSGRTAYIGQKKNDKFLRIYDKKAETLAKTGENPDVEHWTRIEMVLKNDVAMQFVNKMLPDSETGEFVPLGELFRGLLDGFVSFLDPVQTDTNKTRQKYADWWEKFINNAEKVLFLSRLKAEITLEQVDENISNRINALVTKLKISGISGLLKLIIKETIKKSESKIYASRYGTFLQSIEHERTPLYNISYILNSIEQLEKNLYARV